MLIRVFDIKTLLEVRECQAFQLSDGKWVAVWRGLAYALADEHSIDISQPGFAREEIAAFERTALPDRTSEFFWAVIEAEDEAWILVTGNVVARDGYAASLRRAGFPVLRVGVWLGEVVEDFVADWFIRIARAAGEPPIVQRLEAVLGGTCIGTARSEDSLRTDLTRQPSLESDLAAARAKAATFEILLGEAQFEATTAETELFARIHTLEIELATAKEEAARQPLVHLPGSGISAGSDNPQASTPPSKQARKLQDEVTSVLASLLPNVKLLRESLRVATAEYRDRGSFYRTMAELKGDVGRLPPAWKKLRGADGWWERHVSTGEDDSGRVYARFGANGATWQVLLSYKAEQNRDVAWLQARS